MLEVYTWEPNANSGKPLLCLHEKHAPFTHHYIEMPDKVESWLGRVGNRSAVRGVGSQKIMIAMMGPEPGRWG